MLPMLLSTSTMKCSSYRVSKLMSNDDEAMFQEAVFNKSIKQKKQSRVSGVLLKSLGTR